MQLQRFNNAVTLIKHGNSTATEGNNCSQKIQDKHCATEETKPWNFSEVTTMLAPPKLFENEPEKVRPVHKTNSFSQWLLCYINCGNSFFNRRCLTVPVHRRPVTYLQQNSFNLKKRPAFRKCSEPHFLTPNTQNHLITFGRAKTF